MAKLTNENVIRSVSDSQEQILQWIIDLYIPKGRFDYDPTYSKGNFYRRGIPKPKFNSDLITPNVDFRCDFCSIPVQSNSFLSICFDPPFVGGSRKDGKAGIIKSRFHYYKNIPTLWAIYTQALIELHRILKSGGVLVFKCQDSVESAKQYLTHYTVISMALKLGYYPKDLFILVANNRILRSEQAQRHARKFHSYFLVSIKQESKVIYP